MKKSIFKVAIDHILINTLNFNQIDLGELVIGIQIRIYSTSTQGLLYGLNQGPTIPLDNTDLPASYGGFSVDGVPCIMDGNLQIRWNNNLVGQGVVVLTRLVPVPEEQQIEIC
jgi:hypothetical protein